MHNLRVLFLLCVFFFGYTTPTFAGNCPAQITVKCTGSDYDDGTTKVSPPWRFFTDPCPFNDEVTHTLKLSEVLSSSETDVSPTGYSFRCLYKGDRALDEIQIVTTKTNIKPALGNSTLWKKSEIPNIDYICTPKANGSGCPYT